MHCLENSPERPRPHPGGVKPQKALRPQSLLFPGQRSSQAPAAPSILILAGGPPGAVLV